MFGKGISVIASAIAVIIAFVGVGVYVGTTKSDIKSNKESIVAVNDRMQKLEDGWARHLELHLSQSEDK